MKKIYVNEDACIGCGACVALDLEHFGFNDAGFSQPISQKNLESEELKKAISSCPTAAISLTESDGNEEETSPDTCSNCEHCNCKED